MFIDINGGNLCRRFTIGNIYRPPHDNNNNVNIQQFVSELSPIMEILQSENTYAAIVGDFNINLLQISEREKFGEFFDLMCTNNFFPKTTFPTRFARHSCSLIDQIFCKTSHKKTRSHVILHYTESNIRSPAVYRKSGYFRENFKAKKNTSDLEQSMKPR